MIRRLTLVCMCAFVASGLHLYRAKAAAEMEARDIHRIQTEAEATRQRAEVLKNEYQLENNPERLRDLAAKFKQDLTETAPTQFTTLADFERRLPPVGLPPREPAQPPASVDDAVYDQPPAPRPVSTDPAHEDKAALVASAKPASEAPAVHAAPKREPRPVQEASARASTTSISQPQSRDAGGARVQTVAAYAPGAGGGFEAGPYGASEAPAGDRGSALGSAYRAQRPQASQPPKFATATPAPAYQPQRPYTPPQYAPPQYATPQYSQQNAPRPYAPSPYPSNGSGGGSSLGMAHALAPVSYQGGYSSSMGNGG